MLKQTFQATTRRYTEIENVQFDLSRPKQTMGGSSRIYLGGFVGCTNGGVNMTLSMTDCIVKNVNAAFHANYAHAACVGVAGSIFGVPGATTAYKLTNVIAIGKMMAIAPSSADMASVPKAKAGVTIDSYSELYTFGDRPGSAVSNLWVIGAGCIRNDEGANLVASESEFLEKKLDAFYDNLGGSTNWAAKEAGVFPYLSAFPSAYKTLLVSDPEGNTVTTEYKDGSKLSDIEFSCVGYRNDGKWYDDYSCSAPTADVYPVNSKIYYRKWEKYVVLDFEIEYPSTNPQYPIYFMDPLDSRWGDYSGTYTRSDVIRPTTKDGNGVIALTYCNDNPVYRASGRNYGPQGEYFHNYKCSPCVTVYDPSTSSAFLGTPGLTYRISFDYEIKGPVPNEDVSFYLYLTSLKVSGSDRVLKPLTEANGSILCGKFDVNVADGSKGTTNEIEFVAQSGYYPRIVMITNNGEKLDESPSEYHTAYLDNITIREIIPEGASLVPVKFDSDGGSTVSGYRVMKDYPIGSLPSTSRSGYLFDCWYLDGDAEQNEVNSSYVVSEPLVLKAKWVQIPKQPSNYDNDFTSFTKERYPNVLEKYEDIDVNTLSATGVTDSTMTTANRYIKSGCSGGLGGALLLSNDPPVMSNASSGLPATALVNEDGTKFVVKSGRIYKLEFDCLPLGDAGAHSYIGVYYGPYTANTINGTSSQQVRKFAVHGISTKPQNHTYYFKATQDGYVYFTLGTRQNFDVATTPHYVLIDNVKLTVETNVKSITYKTEGGGSVVNARPVGFPYDTQYGKPGDKIRIFGIMPPKAGDLIEGFYSDINCKKPAVDYDVIGTGNKTVYVKFKTPDYSTLSDFTNPITLDFEMSDDFNIDSMYRNYYLMAWTCSEDENTNSYVKDDAENAYSGTGYMRIKDLKYSYGTNGHSFVLYDKNNPSGLMMFEPKTSYRISAQVKYHDDAKLPNIRFWWFNPATATYTRVQEALLKTNLDDVEGYTEISTIVTTGDEATAAAIGAVFLAEQNVYIDDVKVEKLVPATIKFETGGGDPIESMTVIPYSDLSSDSPGFAFKEGYDFVDWYLDAEFTKPFDFLTNTVTGDTVLYAKYVKEAEESPEAEDTDGNKNDNNKVEEDYDDDDVDIDVDVEDEALFGDSLQLLNVSPKEKSDATVKLIKQTNTAPVIPVWLIALICAGGALAIGSGIAAFILIRRKKRK